MCAYGCHVGTQASVCDGTALIKNDSAGKSAASFYLTENKKVREGKKERKEGGREGGREEGRREDWCRCLSCIDSLMTLEMRAFQYFIKTMTQEEIALFLEILPNYHTVPISD